VLVSLFVSFTLTPMLSARWGVDPHDAEGHHKGNFITRAIAAFNRWFDRQAEKYRGVVGWALGHRKSTVALASWPCSRRSRSSRTSAAASCRTRTIPSSW
jgi:HAE1 family hydrophobic/amphiphilic exporter-1